MNLNWRQRLEQNSEYRNFCNWPFIDPQMLPKDKRTKYHRNREIIASVLKGSPINKTANRYNVSSSTINYLLNRSLGGEEDEPPELTTALIPGILQKKSLRRSPLSSNGTERGCRGSFTFLIKTVPQLEHYLDEVLAAYIQRKPYSQNVTPQYFHKEFLRFLRDKNWPVDQYPFDRTKLGYESCRKYYNKRISELKIKPQSSSPTLLPKLTAKQPFDEIQIDAQILDITSSIHIDVNGILESLRISRLSLYLIKDVASDCNLSYQLCFTKHPNQQDVTDALIGIYRPWVPLTLSTPGLKYEEESCLPSYLGNEYRSLSINLVRMDNALCHMAHSIRDIVCNKLNATLNFGLPKQPKGRNYIEYGIAQLSKEIHRFESTTGSTPSSSLKEKASSSNKVPIITLNALEEVLSVLISGHNIKPQARLGGMSPLQYLKRFKDECYLNYGFNLVSEFSELHLKQKVVPVRWIKTENRRPHINFVYVRYTGYCLSADEVRNKKVIVEYDESDIRSMKVITLDGKVLGNVVAPRTWQHYRHSIRTRKAIFKIAKFERMVGPDLLSGYFTYLLKHKNLPKIATELIRVTREFGNVSLKFDSNTTPNSNGSINNKNDFIDKKRRCKIPAWSPEIKSLPVIRRRNG